MMTFIGPALMQPGSKSTFRSALPAVASSDLSSVIERARMLETLDRRLRQSLPSSLAPHVRLGNVRDGKLVFLVTSPVWKAKLRLYADAVKAAATAAGLTPSGMTIKVVAMRVESPEPAAPLPLSPSARETLRAAAEAVADPELREQLLRMASLA